MKDEAINDGGCMKNFFIAWEDHLEYLLWREIWWCIEITRTNKFGVNWSWWNDTEKEVEKRVDAGEKKVEWWSVKRDEEK